VILRNLVEPLAAFIWTVRGVIFSLGQAVPWTVLVLVLAVTLVRALRGGRKQREPMASPDPPAPAAPRIAQWRSALAPAGSIRASQRFLVLELRKLALSVLAHTEGAHAGDLESRIRAGELPVEECVRRLFGAEEQISEAQIADVVRTLEEKLGTAGSRKEDVQA